MAYTSQVEKRMKELGYDLYAAVELLIDTEEELNKRIAELEKEIADHVCEV